MPTLQRIRDRVGADVVADGSYLVLKERGGARVRLDLRLQETNAGETIAAASAAARDSELFELVSHAGDALRTQLGAAKPAKEEAAVARATLPSNAEAARLYAEGLTLLRRFDALAARDRLVKAAAIEPNHPFVHSALSAAWSALGYDLKARGEAKLAFDPSSRLSRADRLAIEARYRETSPSGIRRSASTARCTASSPTTCNTACGWRTPRPRRATARTRWRRWRRCAGCRRRPATIRASISPRRIAAETLLRLQARARRGGARRSKRATRSARTCSSGARASPRAWRCSASPIAKGAMEAYRDAQRIAVAAGDRARCARALQQIATCRIQQGDAGARKQFEEALRDLPRDGDRRGEAGVLSGIATIVTDDNPDEAVQASTKRRWRPIAPSATSGASPSSSTTSASPGSSSASSPHAGKNYQKRRASFTRPASTARRDRRSATWRRTCSTAASWTAARDTAQEALQILRPTDSQPDIGWATRCSARC